MQEDLRLENDDAGVATELVEKAEHEGVDRGAPVLLRTKCLANAHWIILFFLDDTPKFCCQFLIFTCILDLIYLSELFMQ